MQTDSVPPRPSRAGSATVPTRWRSGVVFLCRSDSRCRFRNPLVIILLVAAVISALTGDLASLIIISTIVLMSAVLDTVQEYRAERAAESLKVSVALKEQVLRDGQEVTVLGQAWSPAMRLYATGDLVPADGRLLEARDFFVNEALLTGKSYPAEKHVRDEGVDSPEVANATNAAFMGSSVMNGSAKLFVCAIGVTTQLGQISSSLRRAPPPSALDQGAHRFGMLIVRFTEVLVLFVLLINLLFHRPWLESFLFAVALAVGLTPELLPMIISVTLARGAVRMAGAQVIVKRLGAIHDLGSMDVLCTDKTGTLTEAKISFARQVSLSGVDSERVLDLAWLNSHFQAGLRNPLDAAILNPALRAMPTGPRSTRWFDFQRRRVSVLIEPSVGSVGDSYDNALAETINGLYKAEVIHRRGPWRSFEAVEFATLEWVDWFNNRRLLEPIGNLPPAEAEAAYYAQLELTCIAA